MGSLKMHRRCFVLMSVILMIVDGLVVRGPSAPLVAPLGSSVVLPCYVGKSVPMNDLEVEWRRSDSEALVHLYQNGESRPEVQQQDYHDRAHFFTEEIQHGNFSLRLDDLRAEDKGEYRCTVYIQQDSGETVVQIKDVERLLVSGSDVSISSFVGEDVTLNCSVDSHIKPEHIEEVSWKKTDEDGDILVLLFQNNKTVPKVADEQYRGRVEFFTSEIPKGNFSLRLKSVRTEDKGVYICQVFAGGASANATVELGRLGFSVLHTMVLILCFSASVSALLLCAVIYSRSPDKGFLVWYICKRSVPLGGTVVLPCHVDRHLLKEGGILKVEWRRTDSGTLVHLYQDGDPAGAQQQDYHGRAHFFTEEIHHGNFSLRLDSVKAEDEGEYRCRVYCNRDCVFSANIEVVKGFNIICTHHTLAHLGSSVVLPCYFGNILPEKGLKVEWRKTDSETLVHLYQDGEGQPEEQDGNYNHRANFFTKEIQHGNFSLHLDKLRAEDEGRYTCTVYSQQERLFSVQTRLVPRLLGSLFESVSCSALYFLRPLMLLWAAPYVENFTGKIKSFIQSYSFRTEYIGFSAIFYSVLFKTAWDKSLNYTGFEGVVIIILFVTMLLLNLIYIIFLLVTVFEKLSQRIKTRFSVLAHISFDILPSLQFILLFFAFGSARAAFVVVVLPVFLTVQKYNWDFTCGEQMGCSPPVRRSAWFILTLSINAIMVCFYIIALENEKDRVGWACMITYFQLLWAMRDFTISFECALHRVVPVYVFGSVGVVLLGSVSLMVELLLKTVHAEGAVGDLRIVVFSSEFIFTFFLMILLVFKPWMQTCLP